MLVRVLIGDETAQALGFGEMVGSRGRGFDQGAARYLLERIAGDRPGGERPGQRLRPVAAHRRDMFGFDRGAVEPAPRDRIGVTLFDPFFGKGVVAAGEEFDIGRHAAAVVGYEPVQGRRNGRGGRG